ncbi:MAG: hypothetical protein FWG88_08290 [Oscillospiraceae bacterium]|nr:hypothetical protein [Oscillospiraceae bacterium]
MDRNLQILGLSKKAGLLAIGGSDCAAAGKAKKAHIIISASDASESALRQARKSADNGKTLYVQVPYTSFQIGTVSGRGSPSTVAILDLGLATKFANGLAADNPGEYFQIAETLTLREQAYKRRKRTSTTDIRRTMQ